MSSHTRRAFSVAAVVLAAITIPGAALADPSAADKETARALLNEGDKKLGAKDYAGALKAYSAADAIMNVPTTGIEVAKAEVLLGKLVEARDTALRVTRLPKGAKDPVAFGAARADAAALAADLADRIPSLEVSIRGLPAGTNARVSIDGAAIPDAARQIPRKLDPGAHVVVASAAGFSDVTENVTLTERGQQSVVLVFAPPGTMATPTKVGLPAEQPSPKTGRSPLVWVGFGVGAVGLGVGAVTGIVSISKASSAKAHCTGDACKPAAQIDINSSKTFATVSDIGFGVGLAGVALGVVGLVVLKPSSTQATGSASSNGAALLSIAPFVAPTEGGARAGFSGAF